MYKTTFGQLAVIVLCQLLMLTTSFSVSANETGESNQATVDHYCESPKSLPSQHSVIDLEFESNLERIKASGELKVLLHKKSNGCSISRKEKELIEQFSLDNNLNPLWVYVDEEWNLLPSLMKGKGDIIAGQHNKIDAGSKRVEYTYTWAKAAYKVVHRADNSRIQREKDLVGRQIAAYKNSDIWQKLEELAETLPGLVLVEIPPSMPYEQTMQKVKSGEYDLVVADSLFLDNYLPSNKELAANFAISSVNNMAWAVDTDATDLKISLNEYLNQQHLTHNLVTTEFDDFSGIKDRGILRVITSSNPSHYYLNNGKLYGFEYELLNHFAEQHRLRVDVIVANSQNEMFQLLREGKGDVIAASLPMNLMMKDTRYKYSKAYNYSNPMIVGRTAEQAIVDIRDLSGRRITLPSDSPYWDYMLQLQENGAEFELVMADNGVNMEGTLLMVALGMYDLTVIGYHQYKDGFSKDIGLEYKFNLSEPVSHRWAVRENDKQLLRALDSYIENEYRGEHYNILHARYFERSLIPKSGDYNTTRLTALSPYDNHIQKYASQYAFDWRLITALMFQESQFNPAALSHKGAEGLMQLIPETADFMGVSLNESRNPETSINAGVRYLNYIRDQFEDTLLLEDRIWFTLASYNAGPGRVKKARDIAEEMGLDRNRWFDNVEVAMMKMAQPFNRDGEQIRLCRCGETVVYVREIRTRYFNYVRLTESLQLASLSRYRKPNSLQVRYGRS